MQTDTETDVNQGAPAAADTDNAGQEPATTTDETGQTTDTGGEAGENEQGSGEPTTTADAVHKALQGDDDESAGSGEDGDDSQATDDQATDDQGEGQGEDENQDEAGNAENDDLKAPDGLSDGAKKRFETLAERVRTTSDERDQAVSERDQVVKVMEDTGAPPEQFAQVLLMMGHANSGDPARLEQALGMVDEFRAGLAKQVGKPVAGVNVLDDFPDLQQKVNDGDLDEATAAELATSRRRAKADESRRAGESQDQQHQAELGQRVQKAQTDLTTMGNQLKAKDPDYQRKLDILGKRGFFDQVAQNAPPEQWGPMFKIAYDALGDVASARPPAPSKAGQPMRSTPETGGGAPQPKNTSDAVRLALSEG